MAEEQDRASQTEEPTQRRLDEARRKGDVVSKREVLEAVWDFDFDGDPNIVEVYVGHLRNKVDRPFGRAAIETLRGSGYRLAAHGG